VRLFGQLSCRIKSVFIVDNEEVILCKLFKKNWLELQLERLLNVLAIKSFSRVTCLMIEL
jgi:hypothetical protein